MQYNMQNLELYFDNYNIYNLIKKIDKDYILYYNKKEKLFIIINSAKNNQICLKIDNIQSNIIKTLQKTLVENSSKLFKEIDENNEILTHKTINNIKERTIDSMTELIDFAKKTNSISQKDINKIKEGKYA